MALISRRDAQEAAEGTGLAFIAVVVGGLFICVVGAIFWWLSVATSGAKGTGDLTRQRNSAGNRAHWSAVFNNAYQQIQADQAMVTAAHQAASAPGATKQDQINLTGLIQNCLTDVATYNGDTQNTLAVVPAGLPASIDQTVCGG